MNKKNLLIISILIALIIGVVLFVFFKHPNFKTVDNANNYQANRTSVNNETNQTNTEKISNNSNASTNSNNDNQKIQKPKEETIATFSTKIYSTDSSRQHNINLTCTRLNGTIVKNGSTFSFTGTLGPSNQSKGYQKADIFDKNGNKLKEYGGGNCQISTTLYNAVLSVPSLVVTERHAHSNYVPYIERGKDAAVAYGSYDLKFRNDSGNDIKILTSTDGTNVTATLVSIK